MKAKKNGLSTRASLHIRVSDWIAGIVFFFGIIALLLYSFTQIDLNLTVSSMTLVTRVVDAFRYVGYFARPMSTYLYAAIIVIMTIAYFWLIRVAQSGRMTSRVLFRMVIATALILVVSYPAFSYDFFNYLFTSRTVLLYHANPYAVVPLSYSGVDPYLNFMRWTHLTSAYTPVWIFVSLFPYLAGANFFITEVISFKAFLGLSYVVTAWGIWRVQQKDGEKEAVLSAAFFAFNPLVIIEALVSSHNDIAMMAVAILAMLLAHKKTLSFFLLSVSVSLKMMTFFLIPSLLFSWNKKLACAGMIVGLIMVSFTREPLPWYMVWVIPFASLIPKKNWLIYAVIGASLGFLVRYMPYLYLGNWDPPAMYWKNMLTITAVVMTFVAFCIDHLRTKKQTV
jgi:hypothetical protein